MKNALKYEIWKYSIDRNEHFSLPQSLVRKWVLENNRDSYKISFDLQLYRSTFFEQTGHLNN